MKRLMDQALHTQQAALRRTCAELRQPRCKFRRQPASEQTEGQDLAAAQAAAAAAAAQLLAEEEARGQQQAARAAAKAAKRQRQKARRQQQAVSEAADNPGSSTAPEVALQQGAHAQANPLTETAPTAAGVPTLSPSAAPQQAGTSSVGSCDSSVGKAAAADADEEIVEELMCVLGLAGSGGIGSPAASSASSRGSPTSTVPAASLPRPPSAGPAAPATPAAARPSGPLPSSTQQRHWDAAALFDLACPITQETMRQPVLAADGHTYERGAIQGKPQGAYRQLEASLDAGGRRLSPAGLPGHAEEAPRGPPHRPRPLTASLPACSLDRSADG